MKKSKFSIGNKISKNEIMPRIRAIIGYGAKFPNAKKELDFNVKFEYTNQTQIDAINSRFPMMFSDRAYCYELVKVRDDKFVEEITEGTYTADYVKTHYTRYKIPEEKVQVYAKDKKGTVSEIFDKVPSGSQICGIQTDWQHVCACLDLFSKDGMDCAIEFVVRNFDHESLLDNILRYMQEYIQKNDAVLEK